MVNPTSPLSRNFKVLATALTAGGNDVLPAGAWPFPNTSGSRESWALNLQQVKGDVASLEALQEIAGREEKGFYYFDWVLTSIMASYAEDQEPLQVVLNASMRDAEVARQLKEPRRALARFEKVLVGVASTSLKGEAPAAMELPEKQLIAANWWLRHQLETRLTPWSPAGLAAAVQNYTRTWVNCWENVRLDGGGNTQLAGQREVFWADQKRFIGVLRKALVP